MIRSLKFGVIGAGLAFLYAPVAVMVSYSFNDNRLVTVWSHASLRWYRALAHNEQILSAAAFSAAVAAVSATIAVCLGSVAAFAITHWRRRKAAGALAAVSMLPIIIPTSSRALRCCLSFPFSSHFPRAR